MTITNIKETGANNILMWALKNHANIQADENLQRLISDETFYLVTFSDVNFFELFRMTQIFRNDLRIINERPVTVDLPPRKELLERFNGVYHPDQDDPDKTLPLYELVEHALTGFMNLSLQMQADDDIISQSGRLLFIPMMCRRFDIQIPISFMDIAYAMDDKEFAEFFSSDYPHNINNFIKVDGHGIKTRLMSAFVKSVAIVKYPDQYRKYLYATKYFPVSKQEGTGLYRAGLLGFHQRDPVGRGIISGNFFQFDPNTLGHTLKSLAGMHRANTQLELDFAIKLPLQHMQILENSYEPSELRITYESDMSSIIQDGLSFHDFKMPPDVDPESDDPENVERVEKFNNSVDGYRLRIAEANKNSLNVLSILLENEGDVDIPSAFAILPSLYPTKAVITFEARNILRFINNPDPVISEMFRHISSITSGVMNDIAKSK